MTQDDAKLLASLAAELHQDGDRSDTVRAVLDQALTVVPEADHVSVTWRREDQEFTTLGASSKAAEEADALQYRLDEGPCRDAVVQDGWFRSSDVGADVRWPRWGPQARELGMCSMLSIHLISRGSPVGAINLYSAELGVFDDPDALDRALLWATHVGNAVAVAQAAGDLETALHARHLIGLAQGVVMERLGVSEHEAFGHLVELAHARDEQLRDLAAAILETRQIPELPQR